MPRFDGTGPSCMGPMTGGGRGFCAPAVGMGRPLAGARMFFGRGGGRGWRNRYYATGLPRWQRWAPWGVPPSAEDEQQALKSEADYLRSRLQVLEERLAAMNEEGK